MNPITNSPIKESIRQKYHNIAAKQDAAITNQLNIDCVEIQKDALNRIKAITHKKNPPGYACACLIIGVGVLFAFVFWVVGFVIGAIIGLCIYITWFLIIKNINSNLDASKIRIQSEADDKEQQFRNAAASRIRAAYDEADKKTQQEIARYDSEVTSNCQTILKKPDEFTTMIDHVVNMFQRMISHADCASNKKFVEADLIYKVELYGICYKYKSTYTNPKDDFNFDVQRYRNLKTKEECEGLAQAVAKMTVSKMKSLYPPNSLNITVSHIDAEVTLHFKAANNNYMPPRDIF